MGSLESRSFLACLLPMVAGCGGGTGIPTTTPTRESGQSGLMGETFAGKNACNPKNADRPFVVEWDATDMSSFESFAASDVVVVRYEGCTLTVLDRCRDDSVRGKLGVYRTVDWTTGQLETVDIATEGELYAKLPLGAATLGGRVQGGEKFHMEYYVAGTRNASRTDVYQSDLDALAGCKGATHWVYGYNLGAFALGSMKETAASVDGSIYGFGAGANTKNSRAAEKKGGDLGVCKSEVAKEIQGCKAPIRLVLREIQSGADPEGTAEPSSSQPAQNDKFAENLKTHEQAAGHSTSAQEKSAAGDGKGCLMELDAFDKLNPKLKSTDPKNGLAYTRAVCVMQAGQCDAGKQLMRKSREATATAETTPEHIDQMVQALAAKYCQGANMSQRDQLLKAVQTLAHSGARKVDAPTCKNAYDTYKRLKSVVKPRDEDDRDVIDAERIASFNAPQCFANAKDCDTAFKVFSAEYPQQGLEKADAATKKKLYISVFETQVSKCKGKVKD